LSLNNVIVEWRPLLFSSTTSSVC